MIENITRRRDNVLDLRFGFSPLTELIISYCLLGRRAPDMRYRAWMEETQRTMATLDLPYMEATLIGTGYIPDFLTPTPTDVIHDIEDEFTALMYTPEDMIRHDIAVLRADCERKDIPGYGWEIHQHFMTYPCEALLILAEELRTYWQYTLAHHWARIHAVLENDVLSRARHMALEGSGSILSAIDERLQYQDGYLKINFRKSSKKHNSHVLYPQYGEKGFNLEGQVLQLVPVLFGSSHMHYQFAEQWRPMIMYTPRGTGLWYSPPQPDNSLEVLLGASRARLLTALIQPANTGELARRLSLTAGAVSQQLGRLSEAGLVESQRHGKMVHYRLSYKGEQLLALF
ncbi:MAG: ArsR/SmtB family transcription factor [Aggregatilineales bacterium]